jgi:hypothetical protein
VMGRHPDVQGPAGLLFRQLVLPNRPRPWLIELPTSLRLGNIRGKSEA